MFEKANCTVTYLQHIEFSPFKLNDLPLGEFRALTQEELDALKKNRFIGPHFLWTFSCVRI